MTYPAFMTDPAQLAGLNGQQYLVLRPVREVASFYVSERRVVHGSLPREVPSPHTGHVTLRGFAEPHRHAELVDVVTQWANDQEPIVVEAEALGGFPPPFSVLIARVTRTSSLVGAYDRLTTLLDVTDLRRIGELPLADWVFHMSLAYCGGLDEAEWASALDRISRSVADRPREVLSQAELVWYEEDVEQVRVIPLGGRSG
jgi:hypothetical protein